MDGGRRNYTAQSASFQWQPMFSNVVRVKKYRLFMTWNKIIPSARHHQRQLLDILYTPLYNIKPELGRNAYIRSLFLCHFTTKEFLTKCRISACFFNQGYYMLSYQRAIGLLDWGLFVTIIVSHVLNGLESKPGSEDNTLLDLVPCLKTAKIKEKAKTLVNW